MTFEWPLVTLGQGQAGHKVQSMLMNDLDVTLGQGQGHHEPQGQIPS
jgi:hypothetical protein